MINRQFFLQLLLFLAISLDCLAFAFKSPSSAKKDSDSPAILKADIVNGDRITNIVTATGNVEVVKDNSKLTSDLITYDKNTGWITAIGNVRIKDLEAGKVRATKAKVKNDFSKGIFFDDTMIFNDGSYLISKRADRESPVVTTLDNPIFSLCPNKEINLDNDLVGKNRDPISLKAKKATIDREDQSVKINHGILRFYNIPVIYTPYMKFPLPDNKRKSGFLAPAYIKNNRFGLGLITPFFVDIAPNADLTVTPKYYLSGKQFTIDNEFRHLTAYGQYNLNFEISNNKVSSDTDRLVINRTNKEYRWLIGGGSQLNFNDKNSLEYKINTASDRNYLRDYNYSFLAYTISDAKFDHTDGRQYFGVKTVRIQELVDVENEKTAPLILPSIDHYIESKPFAHGEKIALSSNFTTITRYSGLQYRRASFTPEIKAPLNFHGNLFNFNARIQGDIYSLENNYQYENTAYNNAPNYDSIQTNYKPEISASWRLPLIQKKQANTLLVEPIVNFVSSTAQKNFIKLPNEDSNNSELTVNNLFINNRIAGYDRNETGERVSYGAKTSMFNKYGQFGLTVGQSYRFSTRAQDISIRGFNNNNKSNIVGELSYKIPRRFNMIYSFQLNESSYRNDVNSLLADLTFDKFFIGGNYLLIRQTATNNSSEVNQGNLRFGFNITPKLTASVNVSRDFILDRVISRALNIDYIGCCMIVNFAVKENNSINLITPQTSYQINFLLRSF